MNPRQRSMVRAASLAALVLPPLTQAADITLPLVPIPIPIQLPVPLSPNLLSTNNTLQQVCGLVQGVTNLTPAQLDLANTCRFLASNAPAAAIGAAYQAIIGQQINALEPQLKLFELRTDDLLERLSEVRQPGEYGPAMRGGGSGDATTLLDGRLGLWTHGKFQNGRKSPSPNTFDYSIHDNTVTVGADYRVTDSVVAGLAYEDSTTSVPFTNSLGRLDLHENGVNLYGSFYRRSFYADLLAGYGNSTLDSTRNLNFTNAATAQQINQQAFGRSNVRDLSVGINVGDTLAWQSLFITPEASLSYREARLNPFTETVSKPNAPGSGLALSYGATAVDSLQLSAGIRAGTTLSTRWAVLQPQLHTAYIAELRDAPTTFTASFAAAAPLGGNAATPIAIQSDKPDSHFFASGVSVSATFERSLSLFLDYDFLSATQYVSSHTITVGLRYRPGS